MIKRIQLLRRHSQRTLEQFRAGWFDELAPAPSGVGPTRAVACTSLEEDTPHDGICMEWFADLAALRRCEVWRQAHPRSTAGMVDPDATVSIIVEELVLRGADWLERRWSEGGPKLKHMAFARRAQGLDLGEFSARWRGRPGRIGGAIVIPEAARGQAYVQNHPIANLNAEGSYDAINEVYFDDLTGLRSRMAFFQSHDVARADAELVSEARFLVVDERML